MTLKKWKFSIKILFPIVTKNSWRYTILSSIQLKKMKEDFFCLWKWWLWENYLWKTLISKLRSESKIVLPVASSGIAATLMAGGRTTYSRFKIYIVLLDHSMCCISHQSDIAQLIRRTSLIIWDEAPMQYRYSFECLDRSLRDIMKSVDSKRFHIPFGGITVVLGGDFRQILPVIPRESRSEVVSACITKLFSTWIFELHKHTRFAKPRTQIESRCSCYANSKSESNIGVMQWYTDDGYKIASSMCWMWGDIG